MKSEASTTTEQHIEHARPQHRNYSKMVDPIPFEDMTLPEVVYAMLSEKGPMSQSELAVCMMEAGYQTTQAPKALRDSVGLVLRKDGERFRKVGV